MMQLICTWVGILFMVMIICFAGGIGLVGLISTWKDRKQLEKIGKIQRSLHTIARYCGYEFPQIHYTVDEMLQSIEQDYPMDGEIFRKKAREMFGTSGPHYLRGTKNIRVNLGDTPIDTSQDIKK